MTFQYLIKFADKEVPEKQEINISFIALNSSNVTETYESSEVEHIELAVAMFYSPLKVYSGIIQFSIKHTARSWGSDLETWISKTVRTTTIKDNNWLFFVKKNVNYLRAILLLSLIISGFFLFKNFSNDLAAKRSNTIEKVFSVPTENFQTLDEKLKFIAVRYGSTEDVGMGTVLVVLWGVFSIILILSLNIIINLNQKRSHILLTDESEEYKRESDNRFTKAWIFFTATVVLNLLINISSNFIYDHFFKASGGN